MSHLQHTIRELKNNPKFVLSVWDVSNNRKVVAGATQDKILANFETIEKFFEDCLNKTEKIKITNRNKNGSSSLIVSEYLLDDKGNETNFVEQRPATPNNAYSISADSRFVPTFPQYPQYPQQGMNGMHGGMNNPVSIYKEFDHDRLMKENAELKTENKALIKENQDMSKKILIHETLDGKSIERNKSNAELLTSVSPLLAPFLEKLMGSNAPAQAIGLGQPQSEIKNKAFEMINQLHDDEVKFVLLIAQNLNLEGFDEDLYNLLVTHKLIQQQQ